MRRNQGVFRFFLTAAIILTLSLPSTLFSACNKKETYPTVWTDSDEYVLENTVMWEKPSGELNAYVITDLQIGAKGGESFRTLRRTIRKMVKNGEYDLIIVTGDLFEEGYKKKDVKRFLRLMRRFKCPYIVVLGESDRKGKCSLDWTLKQLENEKNCLFLRGPENLGIGNFVVNVYENLGGRKHILQSFICLDSSSGDGDIATFSDEQTKWVGWALNGVKKFWKAESVQSTIVTHKPFSQMIDVDEDHKSSQFILNEPIELDGNTDALVDACKQNGEVRLVLCGHKHYDYGTQYNDGIRYFMSPKCGYLGKYESSYVLAKNEIDSDICCGWGNLKFEVSGNNTYAEVEKFYPRLFFANGKYNDLDIDFYYN